MNSTRTATRLTLLGLPGSGKGTYGSLLASHLQVPIFTASTIMKSKMTPELKEITKRGGLVPDSWIGGVMKDAVSSSSSYILDGYPRTRGQGIQCLDDWEESVRTQMAVYIDVPKSVVLKKLSGRLVCVECGRGYNDVSVTEGGFDMPAMLPSNGSRTNCECGGCLRRRNDDSDKGVVEERLRVYEKQTKPVIDLFADRGRLCTFRPYKGVADIEKLHEKLWTDFID